jgi:hypothetical protein
MKIAFRKKLKASDCGECFVPCSSVSFVFPSAIQNLKIKIYRTIILVVLYWCEM